MNKEKMKDLIQIVAFMVIDLVAVILCSAIDVAVVLELMRGPDTDVI